MTLWNLVGRLCIIIKREYNGFLFVLLYIRTQIETKHFIRSEEVPPFFYNPTYGEIVASDLNA